MKHIFTIIESLGLLKKSWGIYEPIKKADILRGAFISPMVPTRTFPFAMGPNGDQLLITINRENNSGCISDLFLSEGFYSFVTENPKDLLNKSVKSLIIKNISKKSWGRDRLFQLNAKPDDIIFSHLHYNSFILDDQLIGPGKSPKEYREFILNILRTDDEYGKIFINRDDIKLKDKWIALGSYYKKNGYYEKAIRCIDNALCTCNIYPDYGNPPGQKEKWTQIKNTFQEWAPYIKKNGDECDIISMEYILKFINSLKEPSP